MKGVGPGFPEGLGWGMPSPGELSILEDLPCCFTFGVTHGMGWGSHLPPHTGQPAKGSHRSTQPCITKQGPGSLVTITPCPEEAHRETQQGSSHPLPAGRNPKPAAWEFIWAATGSAGDLVPSPSTSLASRSLPDPNRDVSLLISKEKDITVHIPYPGPGSFYCTVIWPLPGLFEHPSPPPWSS